MLTTLYHLFPPTIHPMVIHFTIAIIYLSLLAGLVGLFVRRDSFYGKAFLILLGLSILATLAAGVAGVISEFYATIPHGVGPMLSNHKRDGELTGVVVVIAFVVQAWHYRTRRSSSVIAVALSLVATILVSITGFIGGSMVYDHGLGIRTASGTVSASTTAHRG